MKRIILLTALTIGMLFCLATSSYATGLSSNLVTNGDGDNLATWNKDTSESYVDHWSQVSDLGGTAGYAPVSPFDSGAIGDNEFFDFWDNSTTNKTGCLYQDIALTDTTGSLFSDIDAGNIGLNAQAYIFKYLPGDGGTIQIKFLDGSGSEIAVGPYRSSRDTNDLSNWELVQVQHVPVPSGARTIRVMLIAYAPDGNSYVDFDGIDVELCNLPDISIANSTANHTYNGTQTITMSGTASDPDGLPVTVSAAISGITQSTTIASGAAWNLSWDIASLGITDGDYTNIQVTADNGKGIRTATYTGTLAVDGTAPATSSLSPSDNATNVGVNDNLVINFSENVVVGTGNITIKKTSDDSMVETIDVTGGKVTGSDTSAITVDPATTLDGETGYYVVIDATAFSDTAGNSYVGISSSSAWNFTTADITAPTVSSIDRNSPAGESTNATSVTYRVTFSEAVTGVDTSDFTLTETGTAHGIIAAVSAGSGTTIDVTVSGITGDGTLRLDLNSSGTGITDDAGNALATGYTSGQTYTFDTTAPTGGSISINSGADYTTSTSVTLTLSATGASEMMVSEDSGFSGASYEAYAASKSFTLSSGDGTKTVYVKYRDAAGNETSETISDSITLDTFAPTLSVSAPSAALTASSSVTYTVTYTGADAVTLASGDITLNKTGTADGTVAVTGTGNSTRTVTISSITGDGTLGISIAAATASDTAGNTALSAGPSGTFTADNTAPIVSISAPSVLILTANSSVTYTVTYTGADAVTLASGDITLNKTGTADGTVTVTGTGNSTRTVTISSITGDGTLGISIAAATASDTAGNTALSAGPSDTFTVDNTAPTGGSISINGGAAYTSSTSATLTLSAAGASEMMLSEDSSFTGASYEAYTASKSFTLSSGDGTKTVYVKYRDAAGNESATISDSITLDTTAPTGGSISINGGDTYTTSTSVTLTLSATGASEMMLSEDSGFSGGSYEAYATSKSFTLSSGDGTKTVYVKYRNAAGNETGGTISDSIMLDTTAPTLSISAPSHLFTASSSVTYAVYYAGADAVTLASGDITLNKTDTADGTVAVTGTGNSTRTVTISSITGDGTLSISIAAATASDTAGNTALSAGPSTTFTVDNTAPTGGSISINGGDTYTNSTSVTLTLSAMGASQMMLSEDSGFSGASYEAYSTSKSFTLSSGDGIKTVYAKYKDAAGNETSATISDTITLVTTAATYTVTYNGNGSSSGSVPIDSTSYNSGDTVTVAGNGGGLTKTGYTFTGWNTAANGSGTTYAAGSGTFIISADTTLYAKWVLNTASAAADLSFLYVSPGTLSPGFSASETEYTVSVGNLKDSMTVTACVYDTSATLKINGETPTVTGAVYGEYAATIDLEVGSNNIISVEVTARDGTTTKTYTITATRAAASHHSSSGGGGGSGGSNSSTTTDKTTTKVVVNGEEYNAGTTTTTTEGSRTVTIVTVDDDKIEALLEAKGNNTTVEIPISSTTDIAEGVLSGQTIKNMEAKAAVLVVKTDTISYTLPASEIDIDSVSEQIGAQAALKDIAIHVIIAAPPADTVKIVTDTADKNSYQIVVNPVEFEIICTNGDKTVEVSKFKAYVERTIAIPEGVDPLKITTAVVLNADGTLTHVPTQIISIDGKYYAKINSLTNSTYTVIYNPKEFKDVENHWAKEVVNDMGSRLVINGIGGENFAPDKDVTRAEFAAIMVKALGLKAGSGASGFDDVKSSDWYSGYIKTAAEYGIISGYANGSFGPADKITREQAMTMIARAMKITGLKAELAAGEEEKLLSGYEDREVLAEYARSGIAECIKTGVVSGKSSTGIAPKDNISRAEVAVMVRRLLQKSGLI